tara:strand:+ start:211 stop:1119 length:909 start_codon:yes stop_codon:yes gene_type:complete
MIEKILKRLLGLAIFPFTTFLTKTRFGRDCLFSVLPKNELVITKTKEGLYYVINTSDDVIGRSIFINKQSYGSQNLIKALELVGKHKSTILDVGANIGTIGISGISHGYFAKCMAFEPEPNNFKLLQTNVNINELSEKFELRNEALSNITDRVLDFELSNNNFGDHRVRIKNTPGFLHEENRKLISVNVNTLDHVLRDYDLSECFLFMDTQGHEGHILSGALKLIDASVPIVTEFWPYGLKRSNGLDMFYKALSASKYTTIWDLSFPDKKIKFSIDELKSIALNLGEDGAYTDLIFTNERVV